MVKDKKNWNTPCPRQLAGRLRSMILTDYIYFAERKYNHFKDSLKSRAVQRWPSPSGEEPVPMTIGIGMRFFH